MCGWVGGCGWSSIPFPRQWTVGAIYFGAGGRCGLVREMIRPSQGLSLNLRQLLGQNRLIPPGIYLCSERINLLIFLRGDMHLLGSLKRARFRLPFLRCACVELSSEVQLPPLWTSFPGWGFLPARSPK